MATEKKKKKKKKVVPNGPQVLARFGPYLTRRRRKMQWSLRDLAKRAGTAHSNVFQWEKLKKDPRLTELDALARAFDEPLIKFIVGVIPPAQQASVTQQRALRA